MNLQELIEFKNKLEEKSNKKNSIISVYDPINSCENITELMLEKRKISSKDSAIKITEWYENMITLLLEEGIIFDKVDFEIFIDLISSNSKEELSNSSIIDIYDDLACFSVDMNIYNNKQLISDVESLVDSRFNEFKKPVVITSYTELFNELRILGYEFNNKEFEEIKKAVEECYKKSDKQLLYNMFNYCSVSCDVDFKKRKIAMINKTSLY